MTEPIKTRSNVWNHEREALRRGIAVEDARREWVQKLRVMHGLPLVTDWTPKGKVEAEIHQGRWVVECPVPGCTNAELGDPAWPRFVCCGGCGCGPLAVVFPAARQEIEALLLERPVPATRGWLKHETVADLKRENKEHADDMARARELMGVE